MLVFLDTPVMSKEGGRRGIYSKTERLRKDYSLYDVSTILRVLGCFFLDFLW